MVRPQHGRPSAAHDLGRGGTECAAGTCQRRSHRAGALVYSAGEFRADRGAARVRLPDRLSWRQWLLRGDVCGGADRGVHRLPVRSRLSVGGGAGAAMAGVTDAMRRLGWGAARLTPIVALLAAWEIFARSGAVTPFMLPAPSAVTERIYDDALGGDLFINIGVTLYRALTGFAIAAVGGVVLGTAMARSAAVRWFFDPIISVGFPMPKIAFLPVVILSLWLFDRSRSTH